MVLNLPWTQKQMFWAFGKGIFQYLASFWVMKFKPFSEKERQSFENYLYQNLVIGTFLENGFEGTLSSKTNVLRVWKGHFLVFLQIFEWQSWNRFKGKWDNEFLKLPWTKKWMSWAFENGIFPIFCKYLSDEVQTIFCESEAKLWKLFISKFGHRKLLRKWFWRYLELKNECSKSLKRAFFSVFANFWVTKLKPF